MLKSLRIENLILIRSATIEFGRGLNILTGESGAGKSAILAAIRYLCGERADTQTLGDPQKPAIIEGEIELDSPLIEPDLLLEGEKSCTLRREILPTGKSRAFCNDRLISASELKKITTQLLEFADQDGARELLSPASQRTLLDQWANIDTSELSSLYQQRQTIALNLSKLRQEKESAAWKTKMLQEQIGKIEEVDWKEGEEELLSKEHLRYANAAETFSTLSQIQSELAEGSLPQQLKRLAAKIPPHLKNISAHLLNASIEIQEGERLLDREISFSDPDPQKLEEIEKRLFQFETLKKKFGKTREEILSRLSELKQDIRAFETIDETILSLEAAQETLFTKIDALAKEVSHQRKMKAADMKQAILQELHMLHLPHAQFEVAIEPKELSSDGADFIRFLFSANANQALQPLEECASGGEQSRLFFALKSSFAAKENRGCLVLDEVDSNVGGIAAAVLGEKLKELGAHRQIICITHFAQSARHAKHHFLVEKLASATDTQTIVRSLSEEERALEYIRMTGGDSHRASNR